MPARERREGTGIRNECTLALQVFRNRALPVKKKCARMMMKEFIASYRRTKLLIDVWSEGHF